jgi:hypothetical protein
MSQRGQHADRVAQADNTQAVLLFSGSKPARRMKGRRGFEREACSRFTLSPLLWAAWGNPTIK